MNRRTGVRCFTRLFGGTVLIESARPIFDSEIVPEYGDTIYTEDASTLQVQRVDEKLVEKVIIGPPRGITLPPNWETGEFDPKRIR